MYAEARAEKHYFLDHQNDTCNQIINVDCVLDSKSRYFELGKFSQINILQSKTHKFYPQLSKQCFPVEIIHHRTKTGWGNHAEFQNDLNSTIEWADRWQLNISQ